MKVTTNVLIEKELLSKKKPPLDETMHCFFTSYLLFVALFSCNVKLWLTLLHSEQPKHYRVLVAVSAVRLNPSC